MPSICRILFTTFFLFTLGIFSGCSTGYIRIQSEPRDAKAILIEPTTGQETELGITPIEAVRPTDDAFTADLLIVEISKKGFKTERFWMPNTARFNHYSTTSLDVKLTEDIYNGSPDNLKKAWDKTITMLTEAQRLVNQRKFTLALAKVYQAMEGVGEFPQALHMIGSIQYIKGEHEKSKKVFQKILENNPDDPEAARMIRIIGGKTAKGDKKSPEPGTGLSP